MMKHTILTIGALTLAIVLDAKPSQGSWYDGKWCAYERGGKGVISSRCDLMTYEACRAWMNASSGTWCTENPRYRGPDQPNRRKVRRIVY